MKTVVMRLALTVFGILAFALSMNMFAGYKEYGTHYITYAVIALFALTAAVAMFRDERHAARGLDADEAAADGPATDDVHG